MAARRRRVAKPLDVYIRVSVLGDRDIERVRSFDDQLKVARGDAATRGYEIGKVFDDGFRSGGKADGRQQYAAMIERLDKGVSGGIVVLNQARLWRNAPRMMDVLMSIVERGGRFVAIEDGIDTDAGDMTLLSGIKALIDQDYRRQRIESAFRSDEDLIAKGCYLGSFVPPGFVKGEDLILVHHATYGPVMVEAFEMRARDVRLVGVADFLHERQVRGGRDPERVKFWTPNQVKRLLANRVYIGEVKKGSFQNPDAHPPLVDRATFEAANQARGVRPGKRRQGDDDPVLLRGPRGAIVRCQGCGHTMKPDGYTNHKDGIPTRVRMYRCRKRHDNGFCPEPATITAGLIEPLVTDIVLTKLGAEDATGRHRHTDVAGLERAVKEAEDELDIFVRVTKASSLGVDRYAEEMAKREAAVLDARSALAEVGGPTVVALGSRLMLADAWPELSMDKRRAIIVATVDHVVIRRTLSGNGSEPAAGRVVVVWAGQGKTRLSRPGFIAPIEPYFDVWPVTGEPLEVGAQLVERVGERPPRRKTDASRRVA